MGLVYRVQTGIRELKSNLSRFVHAEAGQRVAITVHGRVVAALGPPGDGAHTARGATRFDRLVTEGVIQRPPASSTPIRWPDLSLPKGTAASLIDDDRGDA